MDEVKIPKFLARMKELTENLGELYLQREKCSVRIKDAARYFLRDLTEKERTDGLETLNTLLNETRALDLQIRASQSEYCMLLEAKATGYVTRVFLPEKVDAAGDKQPPVAIDIDPWADDGNYETIAINPEELWVVRMVQKLFGVDATDIRKIDLPESENSLDQSPARDL